jgi:anti-anti-sigma regulatory factor
MTVKGSQIEVTVMGEAGVVRFMRTECLLWSLDPRSDIGEELFALVDREKYSVIVIDFSNPDIHQFSGAFQALLVNLHLRLSKANMALKLCNLPPTMMEQFRMNRLTEFFTVCPSLEAALTSEK